MDAERRELGAFLRGKRTGLGVRREDVAEKASVGYDWYVRIEQGRARASAQVLASIGEALGLAPAELAYVQALADDTRPARRVGPAPEVLPPAVLRVMHAQHPSPAYVLNTRFDVLAWNDAVSAFYGVDFASVPVADRNVVWLMLTHPVLAERVVDCAEHARLLVHRCRAMWAGRSDEPAIRALIDRMSAAAPRFREWWAEPVPEALDLAPVRKVVRDPELGLLGVEQTAWLFGDASEYVLILSSPLDGPGHDGTAALLAELARR